MAHLTGLSVVLELVAAAASLWTETNLLTLLGTLCVGAASAACAALRAVSAPARDEEDWQASLRAQAIRR